MPTAAPAMNRPMMSMLIDTAPACKAHPNVDTRDPRKIERFRPSQSPSIMLMIVPRIAPPWKEETTPPVTVLLGLEKYSIK